MDFSSDVRCMDAICAELAFISWIASGIWVHTVQYLLQDIVRELACLTPWLTPMTGKVHADYPLSFSWYWPAVVPHSPCCSFNASWQAHWIPVGACESILL